MKARLLMVCAVLACATAYADPPGLLITPDGYYAITLDANGKPVQEKITQVIQLTPNAPIPPNNGGGGGGTTPTPTGLSAAVAAMSKQQIPDADEGTALTAAIQLLSKSISSDQGIEEALNRTMTVVGLGLNAKTRVDKWYAALKELPGFTFTRAGLQDTLKGLQSAYNVDAAVLASLVDTTVDGAAAGQSVEQINESLASANPNAAFDFTMILTILMAIIDVLKQLGVIMLIPMNMI